MPKRISSLTRSLSYMPASHIRSVAKGSFRGITSTATEKQQAKAELKRRNLPVRKRPTQSRPRSLFRLGF